MCENRSSGFPTRSDTNRAARSLKMARGLKFRIKVVDSRDCTIRMAKTKELISFVVTPKLICIFVFAYAKSRFSHNEAQLKLSDLETRVAIQKINNQGADQTVQVLRLVMGICRSYLPKTGFLMIRLK